MKLLRRHSSKSSSQVEVLLHIEDLYPWPAQHGTLAVQFLRGKRAGQTKPQNPDDENTLIASYTFDETLTVPATLYRTSSGDSYEEKKLSIFIAQVDDKGKELSVLGGVELNLADFAHLQGSLPVRQNYPVECSSSIWKPAGGRPKLTMSVAVARTGDKDAEQLKAELSGPLSPVDEELPSTLSTDVEDEAESVTTSPEPHVAGGATGSTGGKPGLFGNLSGRYGRGSSNNLIAAGAAAAAVTTTAPSPSPAKSENLIYDSDGFLIDSELTGQSPSEATTSATAAAGAAAGDSASAAVVKRNLNKDLDDAISRKQRGDSPSPLGGGGVPSAASGTVIKKDFTPAVDDSPGSIDQPSPQQEQPQQPVHARRFSRGDGAALGSRKWAWRRQSNDPGTSDGDGALDNNKVSSPVSSAGELTIPSPTSPQSGLAGTTAAAGAAATAAAVAAMTRATGKLNFGTPDTAATGALGISPSGIAGSLESPSSTASLHRELQIAAALESSIFLAGRGWGSSSSPTYRHPKVEQLQAPARRLARTIIILGPEEGADFGHRAVSAIRAAAVASLSDPQRLLLWWANAVTLRWSFWALGRGSGGSGNTHDAYPVSSTPGSVGRQGVGNAAAASHFDWLSRSLSPALRHLEAQMYTDLINYLWNGVLVPTAVQSAAEAAARKDKNSGGSAHLASTAESKPSALLRTLSNGNSSNSRTTGRSDNNSTTAEGAMYHWIRALRAVDAALTPAGRPPAAPRPLLSLLRRDVMKGMLTRVDGALIEILLHDNTASNGNNGGGIIDTENLMKLELIPISRCSHTPLSSNHKGSSSSSSNINTSFDFISGVELKMAAGRLVEYAATELGIREGPAPRIKEVADLLMTPKSSLGDEEVRRTVAPSLPPGILVKVLQKYQPDDADVSADDRLPPALIKQLRAEAATTSGAGAGGSSRGRGLITEAYIPPVEEVLLEEGIIQPLSLETSAESDDEMTVLEERGDVRYSLLRELWGAVRGI